MRRFVRCSATTSPASADATTAITPSSPDVRQKAQPSEIDAENGHARGPDLASRAQDGAVASQHNRHLDARRQRSVQLLMVAAARQIGRIDQRVVRPCVAKYVASSSDASTACELELLRTMRMCMRVFFPGLL